MNRRIASRIGAGLLAGALPALAAAQDASLLGAWETQIKDWPMRATHAGMLKNGLVLVVDFSGTPGVPDTILFDPNSLTAPTADPEGQQPEGVTLHCAAHAQLDDGRYLFVDGGNASPTAVIFDPDALLSPWSEVPDMSAARFYPTATTLGDGRILVTAGRHAGNLCEPLGEPQDFIEIFDPAMQR